jgi:hypothetical protein
MVLRDGHRLHAIADVQLNGDTKRSGIESKSKSRLSSGAIAFPEWDTPCTRGGITSNVPNGSVALKVQRATTLRG